MNEQPKKTTKVNRVLLGAPKSGSGKTLLTCALLQALKSRGINVSSCKSGPDYIDPMFHKEVLGIPAHNLDTWFTGPDMTVRLLAEAAEQMTKRQQPDTAAQTSKQQITEKSMRTEEPSAPHIVMEGVMGLFDGAGGIAPEGSAYDLARATNTPIILILDAKGTAYSILPVIAGFMQFDTAHLIKGVILNRTSGVIAERLAPLIREKCGTELIGYFPNRNDLSWESRYLGLTLPEEIEGVRETIARAAEAFSQSISVDRILEIMEQAEPLTWTSLQRADGNPSEGAKITAAENPADDGNASKTANPAAFAVRIAVARDEAFCFYYEENMQILRDLGAEIVPFSPIHDEHLPENIHGILLGGGYPELWAETLAKNESMRQEIREAIEGGMPSRAECGGFMYLHETMYDKENHPYPMVGVIPGECRYTGKSQRFGYIEVTNKKAAPEGAASENSGRYPAEELFRIRGHEFHYYDSTNNGSDCIAEKPVTGKRYECIQMAGNHIWGYPHFYYPSDVRFAEAFIRQAEEYAAEVK